MTSRVQIRAISPYFCHGTAIAGCALRLTDEMQSEKLQLESWFPGARHELLRPHLRTPFPHLATRAIYTAKLESWLHRRLERSYLNAFAPGDVAWVWPSTTIELLEKLKDRGHTIILERINTQQAEAKRILDAAYGALGWAPRHEITAAGIEKERRKLALADFVFCPSPLVRDSFLTAGVPREKLLESTYGWDPATFDVRWRRPVERTPLTYLFVGRGDVRKGLPWLLRYWSKADIDGRLVVTGELAPDVAQHCAPLLERDDVVHVPYSENLLPLYESADVFVLPSHEEGSPLVSYLALASGLPCLVSPAAAGSIIRHDMEGLTHGTCEEDAWIAAMRHLAKNHQLRAQLGEAARKRAGFFTWERVGRGRQQQLERLLLTDEPRRKTRPARDHAPVA